MSKLSPEAQALLDAGRDALSPTSTTKESVLRSIDSSLATGTAVAGTGSFMASKPWLALALVAGIGGGWFLFTQNEDASKVSTAPATVAQPAPAAIASPKPEQVIVAPVERQQKAKPALPASSSRTAETAALPRRPIAAPSARRKAPRSRVKNSERELIASAQRAIRRKKYPKAKALLKQHAQEHPDGILGPEAIAARAIVNCLEPTGTNGKAIARRFLEHHAGSPLAPRVRSICKLVE